MPDLGNLSLSCSSSCTLSRCSSLKPFLPPPPPPDDVTPSAAVRPSIDGRDSMSENGEACNANDGTIGVLKRSRKGGILEVWGDKKMELSSAASTSRCYLPFLVRDAKKMAECLDCQRFINPGEGVSCSVRNCRGIYHGKCVEERLGVSNPSKFKCPQHACSICKQRFQLQCSRCDIAFHDKCAPWPNEVIHLTNQPGRVICWRHPSNWRLDKKPVLPTSDMEEVFCRLPLPYVDEEFHIDMTWKVLKENKLEPPPYVHIRRNIYLVKKKRDSAAGRDVGCTNCSSTCSEGCVCRVQCISCSRACHCPETCSNRPFRKEKRLKIVKTQFCGWGVEAAEPLDKGDFIIEYIGEVIDDALCEKRLWDMKYQGAENFYMCEIRKDFTIDATFKGNSSRFLNHSCNPNCFLEKWQVEGETRVGVFAARSIKVGEPLTYDYRFVQFGPEVGCYCGAPNCHGYLGIKKKIGKLDICWGAKKPRSPHASLTLVRV